MDEVGLMENQFNQSELSNGDKRQLNTVFGITTNRAEKNQHLVQCCIHLYQKSVHKETNVKT